MTDAVDATDESEAVESLRRLGLSKYEAQVLIALAGLGTGTARDVDRVTDVPRSQVYGAAESLEERGLVEIQQSSPIQYRAVDPDEARAILGERLEREQDRAFAYLKRAEKEGAGREGERQEGVWSVHGRENVAARIEQMIADADERILYATCSELFEERVATAIAERGEDVDVWVSSDDETVREAFEAAGVSAGPFPGGHGGDVTGRLLAVDGDTVLLSVLGGEGLPGEREESAIWSAETGIASVLLELLRSYLGGEIERKL